MVDTPTTRNRFRKQETGTNTNTWGTNLNQVLDCVDQVTDGVETIALTGVDYTLTTTNYTTADEAKNRVLVLSGVSTTALNLIVPSVEHEYEIINGYGGTVTVKTSAGTGIAIPTLHNCIVYSDGSNVMNGSPTLFRGDITVAGKIHGVTAGTATTDAVNKTQMETAIATAGLPATSGTVLNSSSDTTAGYLGQKLDLSNTGLLIATLTTENPAANEKSLFTYDDRRLRRRCYFIGQV